MTQWSAQVTSVTFAPLTDEQRGELAAKLDGTMLDDAATGGTAYTFTVEADSRKTAAQAATRTFTAASRDALGEALPFMGVIIAKPDKAATLTLPSAVGYMEIAAILGHAKGAGKPLSRQRAREIAEEHPGFPAPFARLATGPVFLLEDVMAFAKNWEAKSGRPRKTSA